MGGVAMFDEEEVGQVIRALTRKLEAAEKRGNAPVTIALREAIADLEAGRRPPWPSPRPSYMARC